MTVATDLQDIIADVSVAITERKTFGRVELEMLRRRLNVAATEQRSVELAASATRLAAEALCDSIDAGVSNLAGVSSRIRQQMEAR